MPEKLDERWREAAGGPSPRTLQPPLVAADGSPLRFGRYRVTDVLGSGSFGVVHKGYDDVVQREVAIKVPHRERVATPADVEDYLAEARVLARLDHPGIVPVYDADRTEDGLFYIVSKFVAGGNLASRLTQNRPEMAASVTLVVHVAEALHHAHQRGLVHRDVKPANILLDTAGQPVVADFGLALREEDFGIGPPVVAGTPRYMSPEQARGEGHRVDARSDIYSLAAVLYELLTGRPPFRSPSLKELLNLIKTHDPRPPRQLNDSIPKELDWICLKALARRPSERYSTAKDFADDLQHWLTAAASPAVHREEVATVRDPAAIRATGVPSPASHTDDAALKVVPKGLRSFDAGDADFFLSLLPGPRDRNGLPESIRFWKARLEERDPEKTFGVGLLYGPSGCGKSSLVKAGLLPRLDGHVLVAYIEATPSETESRLLRALQALSPEVGPELRLPEVMARLRRGQGLPAGKKVAVVLDQFEQWLHARPGRPGAEELVRALRQCDGQHLQCLLLVRDDFGMAATRFFRELEIPILEGQNFATADLFDTRHARKVLAKFGHAFGALPEDPDELTREQNRFLDQAVAGLAEDGRVVSVRLALFAEMVKGKPWTPATLQQLGGTEGIGIAFLEETLGTRSTNPMHRLHERAARSVLQSLLPEPGTDLKGHRRSRRQLLESSSYAHRLGDFQELLAVLDNELRLITPTDPEDSSPSENPSTPTAEEQQYYQLTHDYLVPAIREWLTRKQRQTRRGRTELLLEDRTAHWKQSRENRLLPSPLETVSIVLFTRPRSWSAADRAMLRRAAWVYGYRLVAVLGVLLALLMGVSVAGRRTVLEQYLQRDAPSAARLEAFHKLNLRDEGIFASVVDNLNKERDQEVIQPVLEGLMESLRDTPPSDGRRQDLIGKLHTLLENPAPSSAIHLAAFQTLSQVETSSEVVAWLSTYFRPGTDEPLQAQILGYMNKQADNAVRSEHAPGTGESLRQALLRLTTRLLENGPIEAKPDAFQIFARLSASPDVLQIIEDRFPTSGKGPLADAMLDYVRQLDMAHLDEEARKKTVRQISTFLARGENEELVSAYVKKYDREKPDQLCDWLMKAHEEEDVSKAVEKGLAAYGEKGNRGQLKLIGDYLQGRLVNQIAEKPVAKIRCDYPLEYQMQALSQLRALTGQSYPAAFAAVSKLLNDSKNLQNNEILPAVIKAYVQLRLDDSISPEPLRRILVKKGKPARLDAIRGLGTLHDLQSLPLLQQIVTDSNDEPRARFEALDSIGELGTYLKDRNRSTQEVTRALLEILAKPSDSSGKVGAAAIRWFAKAAEPEQTKPLFALLSTSQREWRIEAAWAIQTIILTNPQGCAPVVRDYLRWHVAVSSQQQLDEAVAHAARSLLRITTPPAPVFSLPVQETAVKNIVRALAEAHRDEPEGVRRFAAELLGEYLKAPAPPLRPDADSKTRAEQLDKWNQWWLETSPKLHLSREVLVIGERGS